MGVYDIEREREREKERKKERKKESWQPPTYSCVMDKRRRTSVCVYRWVCASACVRVREGVCVCGT